MLETAHLDASLLRDILSSDKVDDISSALQAAGPPVLRGNVPAAAEKGLKWPLQPLEANYGLRKSSLLRRMEHFVPFAASSGAASAARADARPPNEGRSTTDARLLHLEQSIARLVNAVDSEAAHTVVVLGMQRSTIPKHNMACCPENV